MMATICWERACSIFGHPKPPQHVWERQFDYFDDDLQRMASTPYDQFDFEDLWYYHHDLAYVELQPDLFAYLFPVCLMDWHQTLMENKPCSHGDSEFHYGLHRSDALNKMCSPDKREDIFQFFRDSFLARLDVTRGLNEPPAEWKSFPDGWVYRFNSLGIVVPRIDLIWNAWWACGTPGQAVAVLKYCSQLMYFEWENPLFREYLPPELWGNDSHILDAGWLDKNVQFLRHTLTVDYVGRKIDEATRTLENEPEFAQARQLLCDWPKCRDLVTERVRELPEMLGQQTPPGPLDDWSV